MKKSTLIILLGVLSLASCSNSSVDQVSSIKEDDSSLQTPSSETSSSYKEDNSPFNLKCTDAGMDNSYSGETIHQVKGKNLTYAFCMKANKKFTALQMQANDGGYIFNNDPINYNHIEIKMRNASTSQYTTNENLTLYYGDSNNPLENKLTVDKESLTEDNIPISKLTFNLDKTYKYWKLFNQSTNVVYFLEAVFSII